MILIGDVGGTNARFAVSRDGETIEKTTVFSTTESSSLSEVVSLFQEQHQIPAFTKGCVAVAAAIHEGEANLTNGDWTAREADFSFPLRLVNDLEAAASGVVSVSASDRRLIQSGVSQTGLALVVGIGTGLGMALLDQESQKVYATEAGHGTLAPFSKQALETWTLLFEKNGRVRVEDVVSGLGFSNLLDIYVPLHQREQDLGKVAGQILLEEKTPEATAALDFCMSSLGGFLGDQIVSHRASKVFLCGGVAQKLEQCFQRECFQTALHDKKPMQHLVEQTQIELICSGDLGLVGALNIALRSK